MNTANRVAFNTIVQYVQLVLNVVFGLISVRLILLALGESDYGIYNVVGGVTGMLSFISSSFAQTSMRYISVSIGRKDEAEIQDTFRRCFWLHFLIALFIAFVFEVLAFFLFDGFLNIPADRMRTAEIIYHVMVFSVAIRIVDTPFKALINSHEKFWFTSFIGIVDAVLKLGIALVITYWFSDKLLVYGLLMAVITIVNVTSYVSYCYIFYARYLSYRWTSFQELREMSGFAGWTLMDALASILNRQGYAVMINKFFGPVMNTTYGLARQVDEHLYHLSSSVTVAMKPQIMKSRGAGDQDRMFRLSLTAGKFGFSMMAFVTIPLFIMMPDALQLWLKEVPEGTALFARLLVAACMIEQLTRGLVYANQAVGNIKWFSIIVSAVRMLALPVSVGFLLAGAPAYVAFVMYLVFESLASGSRVIVLSRISDFKAMSFVKEVFLMILPPFFIALGFSYLFYSHFHSLLALAINVILSAALYGILLYTIGMTKLERKAVVDMITSMVRRVIPGRKAQ